MLEQSGENASVMVLDVERDEDRTAIPLAERLHREFGVPVGILDPSLGPSWKAWVGGKIHAIDGVPAVPEISDDRVSCIRSQDPLGYVWLSLPIPHVPGWGRWVALALFPEASAIWSQRALIAWGDAVVGNLEGKPSAKTPPTGPRPSEVAERLIRRLRVSDPPERFQRRAATAVRETLGVEAVAWIPGSSREPILVVGAVPGLSSEDFRTLAHERSGEAMRICNRAPEGSLLRKFIVASADAQGETGWLVAANPLDNRPFSDEGDLLSTIASLIATQRSNARIYSDLKELLFGVIRALTSAIDAKDRYTSGHSERVARIAVRLGQELGMSPHEQGDLYLMGLLHDVGKIGVEDGVLKKPGKLTPDEYQQVQAHVKIGDHILSDLKKLHHLLPGVAYHHESMDGSGYPAGLRGDAIPLPARILAVADAFDAMSSSRPYRRRLSPVQIDEIFRKGSGVQWDVKVVNALEACRADLDRIRQKGLGESLHRVINETLGRN